jgi:DNA-binding beta-propeller fold protein YncE
LNNQFFNPYGLQQDPNTKTLYIADYQNHRVMSYTSDASTGSVVAGGNGPGTNTSQLYYPVGIYLDSFTNSLIIANFAASNVVRWVFGANNWELIAGNITRSPGSSSTTLSVCTCVTLDPMGNVYVVDAGNNRIQFFLTGQTVGATIATNQ